MGNAQNLSNKGKEFWLGYGYNSTASQASFMIYLSAEQAAKVEIYTNGGTTLYQSYDVPANSVRLVGPVSPAISHMPTEGLANGKSIFIKSDVPITAFSHVYSSLTSGATMLMPVETYGYEYFAVCAYQQYSGGNNAWFYVVASEDGTRVEITPSGTTAGGLTANATITVDLAKGQTYQLLGQAGNTTGVDLTGSHIKSVVNDNGECHPVAVFSGNSRTSIYANNGGDYIQQQVFPSRAWGYKYLTCPTASTVRPNVLNANYYRVVVKDPATVVKVNGATLVNLRPGNFYEIVSDQPCYIEASQPVQVAQYMPSSFTGGINISGDLDPEMMIISPLEQSINSTRFYNNNNDGIYTHYLNVIVPRSALASLRIDGGTVFDNSFVHPQLPSYQVVIKKWLQPGQHFVRCDSGFTAITYGMGYAESYGYNAGTLVNNLNALLDIKNTYAAENTAYTCAGTPFRFVLKTLYHPSSIEWQLDSVKGLLSAARVKYLNPVALDSVLENDRMYYLYPTDSTYYFNGPGLYNVPVKITAPEIEGCDYTELITIPVEVKAPPVAGFSTSLACVPGSVVFKDTTMGAVIGRRWYFGDGTIGYAKDTTKAYAVAGNYTAALQVIFRDGCISDTVKKALVASPTPSAFFVLKNEQSQLAADSSTCPRTLFSVKVNINYKPASLQWLFSKTANISPAADVLSNNPAPSDSVFANGQWQYGYALPGTYQFNQQGIYKIPVIGVSDDKIAPCNTDTFYMTVEVKAGPQSAFNVTHSGCGSDTVYLSGEPISVNGYKLQKWRWQFADGSIDSVQNMGKLMPQEGSHLVKLCVVASNGCVGDTVQKTVVINPPPKAVFGSSPRLACVGSVVTFTDTSSYGGGTLQGWHWDFGNGQTILSARDTAVSMLYADTGLYTIRHYAVAGSCRSLVDVDTVRIYRPVAQFAASDTVVCRGIDVVLTDNSVSPYGPAINSWQWGYNQQTASGPMHTLSFSHTGLQQINLTVTDIAGCQSAVASKNIRVFEPVLDAGPDLVTAIGTRVQLKARMEESGFTYRWQPGIYLNETTILNPFSTPSTDQLYYITATNAAGCSATDSMWVKVFREIKIPNAFSPNGDGINDTWNIAGLSDYHQATVQIFDRYGQVAWESKGYSQPWNGTSKAKPLPVGVYYYVITVGQNGYDRLTGSITLLR